MEYNFFTLKSSFNTKFDFYADFERSVFFSFFNLRRPGVKFSFYFFWRLLSSTKGPQSKRNRVGAQNKKLKKNDEEKVCKTRRTVDFEAGGPPV